MNEQDSLRLTMFASGLLSLMAWEALAPHHAPITSRRSRWTANLLLTAFNSVVSLGICAVCLFATTATLVTSRLVWFDGLSTWPWLRIVIEVVVLDGVIYWQHRVFHAVPWLWRFHSVHHTDVDLDVTTASRFHVGEILLSAIVKLVCALSLGISAAGLMTFEVVLLLAAQFQHANIRLPARIERALWLFVVPPSMHRIHHCPQRRHQDSNYATLLPLWDRLFGTLSHPAGHDPSFGIDSPLAAKPLGLWKLLSWPFIRTASRA